MEQGAAVYSVGYSNRGMEEFLALLRESSVNAIADVRSEPYSKSRPEYGQDLLKKALHAAGISYAFLGRELGARTVDEGCYVGGRVQYDLLAATRAFQEGLDRVDKGRSDHRIALMCAEGEPLTCHRCILVGRHLRARAIPVRHILENGLVEEHDVTVQRLVQLLRIPDLCASRRDEDYLAMAYKIQGDRIAFRKEVDECEQYELWGREAS
ncbi:MAG: DUF488 domain-containing protein [Acidobacteriaceae bacterium]